MMITLEHFINNSADYPTIDKELQTLTNSQKNFLLNKLHILHKNKELLYKTHFHGLYHSEKVMLFAYLIGVKQGLSDIELEILADAGAYHDIGRQDDREDNFHGLTSARMYEEKHVFQDNPLYQNEIYFNILKAITDFHAQNDINNPNKINTNAGNYEIPKEYTDMYKKLAKILKDADALDRKRFGNYDTAALNEKYLRFTESKELVDFSEELNKLYKEKNRVVPNHKSLESPTLEICLHSIGYDFYKIPSIITYGILSQSKKDEYNLKYVRNFHGGNDYYWISVVPASLYNEAKNPEAASNEFINNGIFIVSKQTPMYKPLPSNKKLTAIEQSLPYLKGEYPDEKSVYEIIEPENIVALGLTKESGDKKLSQATFLYNSLDYKDIEHKIEMICQVIEYDYQNNLAKVLEPFYKKHNEIALSYIYHEDPDATYGETVKKLMAVLNKINEIVASLVSIEYKHRLGIEPTIKDMVLMELQKCDVLEDFLSTPDEYIYRVKPLNLNDNSVLMLDRK